MRDAYGRGWNVSGRQRVPAQGARPAQARRRAPAQRQLRARRPRQPQRRPKARKPKRGRIRRRISARRPRPPRPGRRPVQAYSPEERAAIGPARSAPLPVQQPEAAVRQRRPLPLRVRRRPLVLWATLTSSTLLRASSSHITAAPGRSSPTATAARRTRFRKIRLACTTPPSPRLPPRPARSVNPSSSRQSFSISRRIPFFLPSRPNTSISTIRSSTASSG